MQGKVKWVFDPLVRVVVRLAMRLVARFACVRSRRLDGVQAHLSAGGVQVLHVRTPDLKLNAAILFADQTIKFFSSFDQVQYVKDTSLPIKTLCVELSQAWVLVRLLLARGEQGVLMPATRAMRAGELKITGDLTTVPWFLSLIKLMRRGVIA